MKYKEESKYIYCCFAKSIYSPQSLFLFCFDKDIKENKDIINGIGIIDKNSRSLFGENKIVHENFGVNVRCNDDTKILKYIDVDWSTGEYLVIKEMVHII